MLDTVPDPSLPNIVDIECQPCLAVSHLAGHIRGETPRLVSSDVPTLSSLPFCSVCAS